MEKNHFGKQLRKLRDGNLSGPDSWAFRHGHTFLGYTHHVYFVDTLDKLTCEDLKSFLLNAASLKEPTDLQIHFKKPINQEITKEHTETKANEALNSVFSSGFQPINVTVKLKVDYTGWVRMHLFGKEDLPPSPIINQPSKSTLN